MTDFISDNPALASYYSTQNNERAQDLGNIQSRAARQTEGANNAIDAGIRSWLAGAPPQTTPAQGQGTTSPSTTSDGLYDPSRATPGLAAGEKALSPAQNMGDQAIASAPAPAQPRAAGALSSVGVTPPPSTMATMAQTPGTGRALMTMQQGAYDRHFQLLNGMFDALNGGDVNKAQMLAQAGGLNLPPGALSDARVVRALKIAGGVIPYYKDDPQMAGAYLADALRSADQNGGTPDVAGAFQRNMPRSALASKIGAATDAMGHAPSDQAIEAMAGGRLPYGFGQPVVDSSGNYVQPSRTGGAARPVVGPDGKPIAAGARPPVRPQTPQDQKDWTAAISTAKGEKDLMGNPLNKTEEQITERAQTIYDATQHGRARITAPRVDKGPANATTQHAGTEQDPHEPQSDADFVGLPQGAIYRDPGDNQLYRKP
jgi:hypothetical protein